MPQDLKLYSRSALTSSCHVNVCDLAPTSTVTSHPNSRTWPGRRSRRRALTAVLRVFWASISQDENMSEVVHLELRRRVTEARLLFLLRVSYSEMDTRFRSPGKTFPVH